MFFSWRIFLEIIWDVQFCMVNIWSDNKLLRIRRVCSQWFRNGIKATKMEWKSRLFATRLQLFIPNCTLWLQLLWLQGRLLCSIIQFDCKSVYYAQLVSFLPLVFLCDFCDWSSIWTSHNASYFWNEYMHLDWYFSCFFE